MSDLRHKAGLTVVVPTRDSARTLRRCLESVRSQTRSDGTPFPVAIVVVDNQSADATPEIAAALADVFEPGGPERSAQRNRGLELTATATVLFVDSDMVLDPCVCEQVEAALGRDGVRAVVVPEESFGEGFWASCRGLEKRIAMGDPRTEAARGFRVAALRDIGGWSEELTAAEDWELTDRIRGEGWPTSRVAAHIRHDEGRPTLRAVFRKKRYYGQWVAAYFGPVPLAPSRTPSRVAGGPSRLSPLRILGRPGMLARQPVLAAGLVTLKSVDALGVALGSLAARRRARRAAVPGARP